MKRKAFVLLTFLFLTGCDPIRFPDSEHAMLLRNDNDLLYVLSFVDDNNQDKLSLLLIDDDSRLLVNLSNGSGPFFWQAKDPIITDLFIYQNVECLGFDLPEHKYSTMSITKNELSNLIGICPPIAIYSREQLADMSYDVVENDIMNYGVIETDGTIYFEPSGFHERNFSGFGNVRWVNPSGYGFFDYLQSIEEYQALTNLHEE